METRGRKSIAELTIVTVTPGQRIEPPADLSEAEATYWRAVAATKPADWWKDDSAILLKAYCRAAVQHDAIASLIADMPARRLKTAKGFARYERLRKLQATTSGELTTLATKMRLTQQSRYTEKSAATADAKVSKGRPWDAQRRS